MISAILIGITLLFWVFWPPLTAYGGDYIPYMNNVMYIHEKHPLICIFQPNDKSIQFNQRGILNATLKGIGDWQVGLDYRTWSGNWNFKIVYVPLNGTELNEKCSIFILYQQISSNGLIAGSTQFDTSTNSSTIIIYTSIMPGKTTTHSMGVLMPRNLHAIELTTEHELGHAIGLNHLVTLAQDEKYGFYISSNAEKSIMYYKFDEIHPDPLVGIKQSDLDAVINLYGGHGWGHRNTIIEQFPIG